VTVKTLLTGGSGFVGAHIARALLARGDEVRCLVRPTSRLDNLEGLEVELIEGDLTDPASLERALRGCGTVYHCAADYRLWSRHPDELYRANVDGTENLLRAAAKADVDRIVYTSSVGALGLLANGAPADETTPVTLDSMIGHYKRSKYLAERVTERWAAQGLPVVIVNPSTPVGELDIRPTPTGAIIVDFLRGHLPAYVDTGLNFVDVSDVAQGHLLAADKGRIGERYILGHRNLTLQQMLQMLSEITRRPAPRVKLPHWIPLTAAAVDSAVSRISGRAPRVPLESVRMSRHKMYFDARKAVRELGLPQSPVEGALARAVEWFRARGYVS
jgi:dihydroflavonol-4-reductase